MKELYIEYIKHIDMLREEQGYKIYEFVDGIVDRRTYSNYLNGSTIMNQKVLNAFCKKLRLTPQEFFTSYNLRDKDEYQTVINLYFHIKKREFEEARKLLIYFDSTTFKNVRAASLYEYCLIDYNYQSNSVTKESAYESFKKLIDYPNCLEKKSFTIIETLTIQSIAMIESSVQDFTALNFLEKLLLDPTYELISSNRQDILPNLYATVAYSLGLNGNHRRSVEVAKRGIYICNQYEVYSDLDKLYYYVLFGNLILGEPYTEYIPKYLGVIMIKYDQEYLQGKLKMLERDGIKNPFQYVEEYYMKKKTS